ncbi:DNA-binding IclR family transcriptional regulator [Kutzneria buriramensis]|uniref:DNA-binding IclR family transcriptional regulator n=1 Tax=Kutzneria buriramensis TaxID=1045776 RepID=A0A3E0HEV3_9PSEU|nr:DNA-binding IclR family transcriptional regulator [Kutzneria buriramensis]
MVEAAFAVLDEVREQEPARLLDLAAATGIPRPTVHRLLGQLVAVGAVRRDGSRYRLGAGLLNFTAGGRVERQLRTAAARPVAELAARTGAGVTLTIRIGGDAVCLDMIDAQRPLGVSAEPGESLPDGTAQARALMHGRPCIDAGGVLRGLSCVAVPIRLSGGATAAITTLVHGSQPSPALVDATRATAARITGRMAAGQ